MRPFLFSDFSERQKQRPVRTRQTTNLKNTSTMKHQIHNIILAIAGISPLQFAAKARIIKVLTLTTVFIVAWAALPSAELRAARQTRQADSNSKPQNQSSGLDAVKQDQQTLKSVQDKLDALSKSTAGDDEKMQDIAVIHHKIMGVGLACRFTETYFHDKTRVAIDKFAAPFIQKHASADVKQEFALLQKNFDKRNAVFETCRDECAKAMTKVQKGMTGMNNRGCDKTIEDAKDYEAKVAHYQSIIIQMFEDIGHLDNLVQKEIDNARQVAADPSNKNIAPSMLADAQKVEDGYMKIKKINYRRLTPPGKK